jgi:beta-glucosidase
MLSKKAIERYKVQARELVSKMTLEEKIFQMENNAPAIERLGVKSYNWWNEALHGIARAGVATVFPQAISLAATFDVELMQQIGDVVATEGRAKYNEFQRQNDHGIYKGLTFWAPNINIFRDPRWGRGHETYGEDPFLTSKLAVSYITGLQGNDENFLKVSACAKHYCVHSGPESIRHGFDSVVSQKDLYETYIPAFKACVEAGVESVMGAYNSVNGEICCASKKLIKELLRDSFGFDGHFVSDCGAIHDISEAHGAVPTLVEAVAMSVNAGCDLNCGSAFLQLLNAVQTGLVKEKTIDECLTRLMTARYKLGILGDEKSPYENISYAQNNTKEHNKLSLKAAEKCLTLLKNDGLLPVDKNKIKTVAVIGPNADSRTVLQGNYNGTANKYYTVLDSISEYADVIYAQGCHLFKDRIEACAEDNDRMSEAVSAAQNADLVLICVGLDPTIEGEEGDAFNGDASGDKLDLELPGLQKKLIENVLKVNKPTIILSLSGSAINIPTSANAIIQAWYPGAMGGKAIASMIFGEFSPSGRLPVTFYHSADDLPDFSNYAMQGRTYRYFDKAVLFPFGYGLSYTTFEYNNLQIKDFVVSVDISNTGNFDSDEVAQLYLRDDETSTTAPKYQLKGFKRVYIKKGETKTITFTLTPQDLELVLDDGSSIVEKGNFTVFVGGGQPNKKTLSLQFSVL